MQLSKNPRFVQEHAEFSKKIDLISNQQVKKECLQLLRELTRHVQDIDAKHDQLNSLGRMPTQIGSARDDIQSVRKKLMQRLKDC